MIELFSPELRVAIAPHGARIARLFAPDRDGRPGEVVVGLAEADYKADTAYLGAVVGRFANRIAGGEFVLDGLRHRLPRNEPTATLHGGPDAFDHADWAADPVTAVPGGSAVTLRHTSPDGDNGFPGTLEAIATFTVLGTDLAIDLTATTDAPTVVNLTNHAYFNLRGAPHGVGYGGIEEHEITVLADGYLPIDDALIPTGVIAPVVGTALDLSAPTRIGARWRHAALAAAGGFDHCYVLHGRGPRSGPATGDLAAAAHVSEPVSGRTLTVFTDQPGVQFYSGNHLDGSLVTHDGRAVRRGDAFCLEPQHYPDSPNRPEFPSTVLRPGHQHRTRILFRFGTDTPSMESP